MNEKLVGWWERSWARVLVCSALLFAGGGCLAREAGTPGAPPAKSLQKRLGPDGRPAMTEAELTARLQSFADTYAQTIGMAIDALQAGGLSPQQRAIAQQKKAASATRAYAIATQPNVEVALVDMVVNVTIERAVWNGGLAGEAFGDKAAVLTKAYDELHEEVWALAAKVMTKEQLGAVDQAITRWLAEHPDRRYASIVRFEELAKYRTAPIMDIGTPGGLKMLAPVNEALKTAEQLRLLGERLMFLLQRMPALATTSAEALTDDLLDEPESRRLLADIHTLADTTHRAARAAETLSKPGELAARLKGLESAQEKTGALLAQATGTLEALNATMASADRVLDRLATPSTDGKPGRIDVAAYTDAMKQLESTTGQLNGMLANLNALAASPDVAARLGQVDAAASKGLSRVGAQGEAWIDHFFTWVLLAAAFVALLLVGYKAWWSTRTARPGMR